MIESKSDTPRVSEARRFFYIGQCKAALSPPGPVEKRIYIVNGISASLQKRICS